MTVPTTSLTAEFFPSRTARAVQHLRHLRWAKVVPLLVLALVALTSPILLRFDPEVVVGPSSQAPDGTYWFGTDSSGLDIFSRTLAATRLNLMIALVVTVAATTIGCIVGLVIGMNESRRGPVGWVSRGVARLVDLIEAIPAVLTGLVIIAFFGVSTGTLMIALSVVLAPVQIRLVRTEVLRVRSEVYLDAARSGGQSELGLTLRHVLPNSISSAVENCSVIFAVAIIVTAALGFVGAGVAPPTPEWGAMLTRGASDATVGRWWPAAFPALALGLTIAAVSVGFNELLRRRRA
ncbi:ABC transporter permease [Rhodococcus rhodochrous]|uniref:ABC transporter permease n=1 Tax=Rhodococcus rhodochrous TaxID=1829 RepID=UPI001E422DC1|nr:ABC transporter permease [Rhodococcus rhodochrous]MCB8912411.1 ABC transporter permease [Rhodococcus rhodochrous]